MNDDDGVDEHRNCSDGEAAAKAIAIADPLHVLYYNEGTSGCGQRQMRLSQGPDGINVGVVIYQCQ